MRKLSYEKSTTTTKRSIENMLSSELMNHESIDKENFISKAVINISSSVLGLICYFLIETINLAFMGKKGESSHLLLGAVGLGNIYLNFCGDILSFGILGALDTMGSNSYGSKNYKIIGIFAIQSKIILLTFL